MSCSPVGMSVMRMEANFTLYAPLAAIANCRAGAEWLQRIACGAAFGAKMRPRFAAPAGSEQPEPDGRGRIFRLALAAGGWRCRPHSCPYTRSGVGRGLDRHCVAF